MHGLVELFIRVYFLVGSSRSLTVAPRNVFAKDQQADRTCCSNAPEVGTASGGGLRKLRN